MGVGGDASRTSAVDVPRPFFMGLLDTAASSLGDAAYSAVHVNSWWELYGLLPSPGSWASTGSCCNVMKVGVAPD